MSSPWLLPNNSGGAAIVSYVAGTATATAAVAIAENPHGAPYSSSIWRVTNVSGAEVLRVQFKPLHGEVDAAANYATVLATAGANVDFYVLKGGQPQVIVQSISGTDTTYTIELIGSN